MIGSDVVRGMIKLYLNGYLSYDEIVGWANNKYNNSEFIMDAGEDHNDALFDILSLMMEGRDGGQILENEHFHIFLDRLEINDELNVFD